MEVEAAGPTRDLHSGLYGGAAPNAVFGLIELLAKAKNADGVIQIPGIYDDVEEPAAAEKRKLGAACLSTRSEFLKKEVGSTELTGETESHACWSASGRGRLSKCTASPADSPPPAPRP